VPKARIIRPDELDAETPPDLNAYFPCIVAEGDSWFSLGSVPPKNVLQELDFSTHSAVVNLAYPGDTAADMERELKASGGRRVDVWLSEFGSVVCDRSAYRYSAILLSAGGNDLIDAVPHLLRQGVDYAAADPAHPQDIVDAAALAKFDDFLKRNLTALVQFVRDQPSPNRDAPIFIHTYDYPTPNDARATLFGRPVGSAWLYPRLVAAGVPTAFWQPLMRHLVDHLADGLQSLVLPDFHVVRTTGLLVPAALGATGASGDWENEIHATAAGYRKIARKLAAAIGRELGLP
jgi:lysophospholipase L1-like esterase